MNWVALAATIGGSLVGLAGVAATVWSNRTQAILQRELTAAEHQHQRMLASGARLFERRAPVYEETLKLLYPWMERVDATERFMTLAGDPGPPEPPGREEWRDMQVRLRTNGSLAVGDAYDAFSSAIQRFYDQVHEVRTVKGRDDVEEGRWKAAYKGLEEARKDVREKLRDLERLVSDELAAL